MCWCFVSFILKRNLGYSHILSEHYLYCTHILSRTTRAGNSGITKKAICTVHQQYLSTVWVTFQHLAYQITLPHPYIQYKKMPWQLAMNVGVGKILLPTQCSIAKPLLEVVLTLHHVVCKFLCKRNPDVPLTPKYIHVAIADMYWVYAVLGT